MPLQTEVTHRFDVTITPHRTRFLGYWGRFITSLMDIAVAFQAVVNRISLKP